MSQICSTAAARRLRPVQVSSLDVLVKKRSSTSSAVVRVGEAGGRCYSLAPFHGKGCSLLAIRGAGAGANATTKFKN